MSIKAADQVSIVDVTDAYSVILTSEAYTFPGTTDAAKPSTCTTQVYCTQGDHEVPFTIGSCVCPTGVSASVNKDGKTVTVTSSSAMTAAGDVTIPVTINGTGIEIDKKFSCAIAFTGAQGAQGNAGRGISSTTVTYQAGNSATSAPTGSWSSNVVSTNPGQFLWTRTVITYTDSNSTTTYSVAAHGATGNTGATGATGKGVQSSVVTYQLSTSGTDVPTGSWSSSVLAPTTTQYLWTRTIITYTDNSTSTAYSVGGKTGAKGDQGVAGADAITMAITSDHGTIFKNSSGSTTLTAHVYKAGVELSANDIPKYGTIKWYKDNSTTPAGTGVTISVSAASVQSKAVYTCKLES